MNRKVQVFVTVLASVAMVACTSLRVVADSPGASSKALRQPQPVLQPRDIAVITTATGERIEVRITSVHADEVVGSVDGQTQPVRIPVSQIERVERTELDGTKTILAVGAYVLLSIILANVLSRGLFNKVGATN